MSPPAVSVLQQVNQARVQGAERRLRQAQSARQRATAAHMQAEQELGAFAERRRMQEMLLHRGLAGGPMPVQRLRQVAAQLSDLAAHAAALQQRAAQAVQQQAGCDEAADASRRAHAAALREAAGVAWLQQQLEAADRSAAERRQDAELEAIATRCRLETPGWPPR